MVSVVVFEFSGMRCQPLRRALADRQASLLTMNAILCCILISKILKQILHCM